MIDIENLSEQEAKNMLLEIIESSYKVVSWPESQVLMDEEWFEEAILDVECKFGSSAYFIPLKRIL